MSQSPDGSDGKESTCNAGDPGSVSGSGRSSGEGNGNPLQYSCQENSIEEPGGLQSIGSERAGHDWAAIFEKEMATHSSILAWRIPWTGRGLFLSTFTIEWRITKQMFDHSLELVEIIWRESWIRNLPLPFIGDVNADKLYNHSEAVISPIKQI